MKLSTTMAMLSAAVALALSASIASATGTIVGSPHDLAGGPMGLTIPGNQICLPCHTPHGMQANVTKLLWNHQVDTTKTYTLYKTSYSITNLDTSSRLCLSCHDGVFAVDSFGGRTPQTGTNFMPIGRQVGAPTSVGGNGDLSRSHPIAVAYPGATTTGTFTGTDGRWNSSASTGGFQDSAVHTEGTLRLAKPDTALSTDKGTLIGCGTCHTPHDYSNQFLRKANTASALCLTCHVK